MHTATLKKLALALTFWLALHLASLKAQTIPFQLTAGSGGTAVDFEWRLDGSIIEEGSGSSTLSNADLESTSRFIWYPTQGALRAGGGLYTETVSQVGEYSVAFGYQAIASGWDSMAMGYGTASTGFGSMAMGLDTTASGGSSTAMGYGTTASGSTGSTALGAGTTASGVTSTALGYYTTASGYCSTAMGTRTQSGAYDSFAIGMYNVGGGTATSWVDTDPLFEIGNGTSSLAKADALVVYKNGNVQAQGTIRCSPGGDLSMGSFTAGTAP